MFTSIIDWAFEPDNPIKYMLRIVMISILPVLLLTGLILAVTYYPYIVGIPLLIAFIGALIWAAT